MVRGVLKRLFSSTLRVKVLSHFYMHPTEEYHIRGLAEVLGEQAGTLRRELNNLEAAGILCSRRIGNQKSFSLDPTTPIHDDMRNIFLKMTGAGKELKTVLSKLPGVELAFIYGSFAAGDSHADSDIDVMIIGGVSDRELAPAVSRAEKRLRREVNYTTYMRSEAQERIGKKGDFVHEVFSGAKILLVGDLNDGLLRTAE